MKDLITSLRALFLFTILTGILYPLSMSLFAKTFYPSKSQGSLIISKDHVIGSKLIGQAFSQEKYFWGRPSAIHYDSASSGATNQSLTSSDLVKKVKEREAQGFVSEMRFASGSGLDPHISQIAALSQMQRITKARGLNHEQTQILEALVIKNTEDPQFGFLGEPRVNVLSLNLLMDKQFEKSR